ncbi:MAG: type II toxin-antitoxin system RelE/ParE family toxin [Bacteroidetes bacterium]|nr:type II toxin-antitoxin system RelE/ParE family toxin [Bacteroidota bacterium]
MYHLFITEKAEDEYSNAYWYYEEKQIGLGVSFENEADQLLKTIKKNPFLFQRKYKKFREVLLNRFPFLIVYEIVKDKIVIHSFFHTSRNPKKKYKQTPIVSTLNEPMEPYGKKK